MRLIEKLKENQRPKASQGDCDALDESERPGLDEGHFDPLAGLFDENGRDFFALFDGITDF